MPDELNQDNPAFLQSLSLSGEGAGVVRKDKNRGKNTQQGRSISDLNALSQAWKEKEEAEAAKNAPSDALLQIMARHEKEQQAQAEFLKHHGIDPERLAAHRTAADEHGRTGITWEREGGGGKKEKGDDDDGDDPNAQQNAPTPAPARRVVPNPNFMVPPEKYSDYLASFFAKNRVRDPLRQRTRRDLLQRRRTDSNYSYSDHWTQLAAEQAMANRQATMPPVHDMAIKRQQLIYTPTAADKQWENPRAQRRLSKAQKAANQQRDEQTAPVQWQETTVPNPEGQHQPQWNTRLQTWTTRVFGRIRTWNHERQIWQDPYDRIDLNKDVPDEPNRNKAYPHPAYGKEGQNSHIGIEDPTLGIQPYSSRYNGEAWSPKPLADTFAALNKLNGTKKRTPAMNPVIKYENTNIGITQAEYYARDPKAKARDEANAAMSTMTRKTQPDTRRVTIPTLINPTIAAEHEEQFNQLRKVEAEMKAIQAAAAGVYPVKAIFGIPRLANAIKTGKIRREDVSKMAQLWEEQQQNKGSEHAISHADFEKAFPQIKQSEEANTRRIDPRAPREVPAMPSRPQRIAARPQHEQELRDYYQSLATRYNKRFGVTADRTYSANDFAQKIGNLSPEQLAFVRSTNPNSFFLAGAGSGKTTSMKAKVIEMIAEGQDPAKLRFGSQSHSGVAALYKAMKSVEDLLPEGFGFEDKRSATNPRTTQAMAKQFLYGKSVLKKDVTEDTPPNERYITPLEYAIGEGYSSQLIGNLSGNLSGIESNNDIEKKRPLEPEKYIAAVLEHVGFTSPSSYDVGKVIKGINTFRDGASQEDRDAAMQRGAIMHRNGEWRGGELSELAKTELPYYWYEQAKARAKGFELKAPEYQKKFLDVNDLTPVGATAAAILRENNMMPKRYNGMTLFNDEAQDNKQADFQFLSSLFGKGGKTVFGGDLSQVTILNEHAPQADKLAEAEFADNGGMTTYRATENYRSGPINTSFLNAILRDPHLESTGINTYQVSMRDGSLPDEMPDFKMHQNFTSLFGGMIDDMFSTMGTSIPDVVANARTGKRGFEGMDLAVQPHQMAAVMQMKRERDEFSQVLKHKIAQHLNPGEDALAKQIYEDIYSEKIPGTEEAPQEGRIAAMEPEDAMKTHALMVAQARSRGIEHMFIDATKVGQWTDVGYRFNLYTMMSRVLGKNTIYGSTEGFDKKQYPADVLPNGVGVPQGFGAYTKWAAEDWLTNQGGDPEKMHPTLRSALDYQIPAAQLEEMADPQHGAILKYAIEQLAAASEHYLPGDASEVLAQPQTTGQVGSDAQSGDDTITALGAHAGRQDYGVADEQDLGAQQYGQGINKNVNDDGESTLADGFGSPQRMTPQAIAGLLRKGDPRAFGLMLDHIHYVLRQGPKALGSIPLINGAFPKTANELYAAWKGLYGAVKVPTTTFYGEAPKELHDAWQALGGVKHSTFNEFLRTDKEGQKFLLATKEQRSGAEADLPTETEPLVVDANMQAQEKAMGQNYDDQTFKARDQEDLQLLIGSFLKMPEAQDYPEIKEIMHQQLLQPKMLDWVAERTKNYRGDTLHRDLYTARFGEKEFENIEAAMGKLVLNPLTNKEYPDLQALTNTAMGANADVRTQLGKGELHPTLKKALEEFLPPQIKTLSALANPTEEETKRLKTYTDIRDNMEPLAEQKADQKRLNSYLKTKGFKAKAAEEHASTAKGDPETQYVESFLKKDGTHAQKQAHLEKQIERIAKRKEDDADAKADPETYFAQKKILKRLRNRLEDMKQASPDHASRLVPKILTNWLAKHPEQHEPFHDQMAYELASRPEANGTLERVKDVAQKMGLHSFVSQIEALSGPAVGDDTQLTVIQKHDLARLAQTDPVAAAQLERLTRQPTGKKNANGEEIVNQDFDMNGTIIQKNIAQYVNLSNLAGQTVSSAEQSQRMGIPWVISRNMPLVTELQSLYESLQTTGIIDPQAVEATHRPDADSPADAFRSRGTGVPLDSLIQRNTELLNNKDYLLDTAKQEELLAKHQDELKKEGLSPKKRAMHEAEIEAIKERLKRIPATRAKFEHEIAQAQRIKDEFHNPENILNWSHTLNLAMRASVGYGTTDSNNKLHPENAQDFFRHLKNGYRTGMRTPEQMLRVIDNLKEASAHLQLTGRLKRGHVEDILETFGHSTANKDNIGLALLERDSPKNFPFKRSADKATLAQIIPSQGIARAEATRIPLLPNTPYVFMGGDTNFPEITRAQGQTGLTTGTTGYLEPYAGANFGLPQNYKTLSKAGMMYMKSGEYKKGKKLEEAISKVSEEENPELFAQLTKKKDAYYNENAEPMHYLVTPTGERHLVRASQLTNIAHPAALARQLSAYDAELQKLTEQQTGQENPNQLWQTSTLHQQIREAKNQLALAMNTDPDRGQVLEGQALLDRTAEIRNALPERDLVAMRLDAHKGRTQGQIDGLTGTGRAVALQKETREQGVGAIDTALALIENSQRAEAIARQEGKQPTPFAWKSFLEGIADPTVAQIAHNALLHQEPWEPKVNHPIVPIEGTFPLEAKMHLPDVAEGMQHLLMLPEGTLEEQENQSRGQSLRLSEGGNLTGITVKTAAGASIRTATMGDLTDEEVAHLSRHAFPDVEALRESLQSTKKGRERWQKEVIPTYREYLARANPANYSKDSEGKASYDEQAAMARRFQLVKLATDKQTGLADVHVGPYVADLLQSEAHPARVTPRQLHINNAAIAQLPAEPPHPGMGYIPPQPFTGLDPQQHYQTDGGYTGVSLGSGGIHGGPVIYTMHTNGNPGAGMMMAHKLTAQGVPIVDTRLNARARGNRRNIWSKTRLMLRFGKKYSHDEDLGNINHGKPHKPIELKNEERGIGHLMHRLAGGESFALLCACKNPETCHRMHIAQRLQAEIPNLSVVHLSDNTGLLPDTIAQVAAQKGLPAAPPAEFANGGPHRYFDNFKQTWIPTLPENAADLEEQWRNDLHPQDAQNPYAPKRFWDGRKKGPAFLPTADGTTATPRTTGKSAQTTKDVKELVTTTTGTKATLVSGKDAKAAKAAERAKAKAEKAEERARAKAAKDAEKAAEKTKAKEKTEPVAEIPLHQRPSHELDPNHPEHQPILAGRFLERLRATHPNEVSFLKEQQWMADDLAAGFSPEKRKILGIAYQNQDEHGHLTGLSREDMAGYSQFASNLGYHVGAWEQSDYQDEHASDEVAWEIPITHPMHLTHPDYPNHALYPIFGQSFAGDASLQKDLFGNPLGTWRENTYELEPFHDGTFNERETLQEPPWEKDLLGNPLGTTTAEDIRALFAQNASANAKTQQTTPVNTSDDEATKAAKERQQRATALLQLQGFQAPENERAAFIAHMHTQQQQDAPPPLLLPEQAASLIAPPPLLLPEQAESLNPLRRFGGLSVEQRRDMLAHSQSVPDTQLINSLMDSDHVLEYLTRPDPLAGVSSSTEQTTQQAREMSHLLLPETAASLHMDAPPTPTRQETTAPPILLPQTRQELMGTPPPQLPQYAASLMRPPVLLPEQAASLGNRPIEAPEPAPTHRERIQSRQQAQEQGLTTAPPILLPQQGQELTAPPTSKPDWMAPIAPGDLDEVLGLEPEEAPVAKKPVTPQVQMFDIAAHQDYARALKSFREPPENKVSSNAYIPGGPISDADRWDQFGNYIEPTHSAIPPQTKSSGWAEEEPPDWLDNYVDEPTDAYRQLTTTPPVSNAGGSGNEKKPPTVPPVSPSPLPEPTPQPQPQNKPSGKPSGKASDLTGHANAGPTQNTQATGKGKATATPQSNRPPAPRTEAEKKALFQSANDAVVHGHADPAKRIPAPTAEQHAFYTSEAKNIIVQGGPGSGKTDTLVRTLFNWVTNPDLKKAIDPRHVLTLSALRSGKNVIADRYERYQKELLPEGEEYQLRAPQTFASLAHQIVFHGRYLDKDTGVERFPVMEALGFTGWQGKILADPTDRDLYRDLQNGGHGNDTASQLDFFRDAISEHYGHDPELIEQHFGDIASDEHVKGFLSDIDKLKKSATDPNSSYYAMGELGNKELVHPGPFTLNQGIALYENKMNREGFPDFNTVMMLATHAINSPHLVPQHLLPKWLPKVKAIVGDEFQDLDFNQSALTQALVTHLPEKPRLLLGMDPTQNILEGMGGILTDKLHPRIKDIFHATGAKAKDIFGFDNPLTINHRSKAGDVFFTNALLQDPEMKDFARSPLQTPANTDLGHFPEMMVTRTQPELYRKHFASMIAKSGLDLAQVKKNMDTKGLASIDELIEGTGFTTLPKEIPHITSMKVQRELFEFEAKRHLKDQFGGNKAQANHLFNLLYRRHAPDKDDNEPTITGADGTERKPSDWKFQGLLTHEARSNQYEKPHYDLTRVGHWIGRNNKVSWLRNLFVGMSRSTDRNILGATSHPMNKHQIQHYMQHPEDLQDHGDVSDFGDIPLGSSVIKKNESTAIRDLGSPMQGGTGDAHYFLPQHLEGVWKQATKNALLAGVAPDSDYFPEELHKSGFIRRMVAELGHQIPTPNIQTAPPTSPPIPPMAPLASNAAGTAPTNAPTPTVDANAAMPEGPGGSSTPAPNVQSQQITIPGQAPAPTTAPDPFVPSPGQQSQAQQPPASNAPTHQQQSQQQGGTQSAMNQGQGQQNTQSVSQHQTQTPAMSPEQRQLVSWADEHWQRLAQRDPKHFPTQTRQDQEKTIKKELLERIDADESHRLTHFTDEQFAGVHQERINAFRQKFPNATAPHFPVTVSELGPELRATIAAHTLMAQQLGYEFGPWTGHARGNDQGSVSALLKPIAKHQSVSPNQQQQAQTHTPAVSAEQQQLQAWAEEHWQRLAKSDPSKSRQEQEEAIRKQLHNRSWDKSLHGLAELGDDQFTGIHQERIKEYKQHSPHSIPFFPVTVSELGPESRAEIAAHTLVAQKYGFELGPWTATNYGDKKNLITTLVESKSREQKNQQQHAPHRQTKAEPATHDASWPQTVPMPQEWAAPPKITLTHPAQWLKDMGWAADDLAAPAPAPTVVPQAPMPEPKQPPFVPEIVRTNTPPPEPKLTPPPIIADEETKRLMAEPFDEDNMSVPLRPVNFKKASPFSRLKTRIGEIGEHLFKKKETGPFFELKDGMWKEEEPHQGPRALMAGNPQEQHHTIPPHPGVTVTTHEGVTPPPAPTVQYHTAPPAPTIEHHTAPPTPTVETDEQKQLHTWAEEYWQIRDKENRDRGYEKYVAPEKEEDHWKQKLLIQRRNQEKVWGENILYDIGIINGQNRTIAPDQVGTFVFKEEHLLGINKERFEKAGQRPDRKEYQFPIEMADLHPELRAKMAAYTVYAQKIGYEISPWTANNPKDLHSPRLITVLSLKASTPPPALDTQAQQQAPPPSPDATGSLIQDQAEAQSQAQTQQQAPVAPPSAESIQQQQQALLAHSAFAGGSNHAPALYVDRLHPHEIKAIMEHISAVEPTLRTQYEQHALAGTTPSTYEEFLRDQPEMQQQPIDQAWSIIAKKKRAGLAIPQKELQHAFELHGKRGMLKETLNQTQQGILLPPRTKEQQLAEILHKRQQTFAQHPWFATSTNGILPLAEQLSKGDMLQIMGHIANIEPTQRALYESKRAQGMATSSYADFLREQQKNFHAPIAQHLQEIADFHKQGVAVPDAHQRAKELFTYQGSHGMLSDAIKQADSANQQTVKPPLTFIEKQQLFAEHPLFASGKGALAPLAHQLDEDAMKSIMGHIAGVEPALRKRYDEHRKQGGTDSYADFLRDYQQHGVEKPLIQKWMVAQDFQEKKEKLDANPIVIESRKEGRYPAPQDALPNALVHDLFQGHGIHSILSEAIKQEDQKNQQALTSPPPAPPAGSGSGTPDPSTINIQTGQGSTINVSGGNITSPPPAPNSASGTNGKTGVPPSAQAVPPAGPPAQNGVPAYAQGGPHSPQYQQAMQTSPPNHGNGGGGSNNGGGNGNSGSSGGEEKKEKENGWFNSNNGFLQTGRLIARLGSELQYVTQSIDQTVNPAVEQGGNYRMATLQIPGMTTPASATHSPSVNTVSSPVVKAQKQAETPNFFEKAVAQAWADLTTGGKVPSSTPTMIPGPNGKAVTLPQQKTKQAAKPDDGTRGFFNFTDDNNPNTIAYLQKHTLSSYSDTQIAQNIQEYLAANQLSFNTAAVNASTDVQGIATLGGMDPSQLIQQFAQLQGYGNKDKNAVTQQISGMLTNMFKGTNGVTNLNQDNVMPTLNAMQTLMPLMNGDKNSVGQSGALIQTALNAGFTPQELPQITGAMSQLSNVGQNPDTRAQFGLANIYGANSLTASPGYFEQQQQYHQAAYQLEDYSFQSNVLSNPMVAQSAKSLGLFGNGKLSLANLQIQADNAQINLDSANMQAQQFQLAQSTASFNFGQQRDVQLYGPIGQDTSKKAYFDWTRNQLAAGYDPTKADIAATFKPEHPFGLKNEEFYAGIENQRQMMILGNSPLLKDQQFQQQMKYLNQQEEFYRREMALQNDQRAFDRLWGLRSLAQEAATLAAQQGVYAYSILMKKVQDAQLAMQGAHLPQMMKDLSKIQQQTVQYNAGKGPVKGDQKTIYQLIQDAANAYNDPKNKKLYKSDTGLKETLTLLGLTGADLTTMVKIIKQASSKNGDLGKITDTINGSKDDQLIKDLQNIQAQGGNLGQQQQAGQANASLNQGGTSEQWTNLTQSILDNTTSNIALAKWMSPMTPALASLNNTMSKIGPLGMAIGTLDNLIGAVVGIAGGAGGAGVGGAGVGGGGGCNLPHFSGGSGGSGFIGGSNAVSPTSTSGMGDPDAGPDSIGVHIPAQLGNLNPMGYAFFVKFLEDFAFKAAKANGWKYGKEGTHPGFTTPHINAEFGEKLWYGRHMGVDFAASQGSTIEEFVGGKVKNTGQYAWGGEIDVEVPGGYTERYLHMSQINVKAGQEVKQGQEIGLSGGGTASSGYGKWSHGPHLHIQYDKGNINAGVDPWTLWPLFGDMNLKKYVGDSGNSWLPPGSTTVGSAPGHGKQRQAFLAEGGVATFPQQAWVAEREPEAIIPLSKLSGMISLVLSAQMTPNQRMTTGETSRVKQVVIQKVMETFSPQLHIVGGQLSEEDQDRIMSQLLQVVVSAVQQAMVTTS